MKRTLTRFAVLASLVAVSMLSACSGLPTAQERFQTACTIVNGDLAIIGASPLLNADQQKIINEQVLPANKAICAAGGQLNVASLKQFHDSLLPAAVTIVQAVPAIPNQTAVLMGLQTFGPMLQVIIDQLITTAAKAPDGASSPLAGAPIK